eukprot:GFKZ01001070.1.p4 GENE.GFKZ01001070.1~~GFKZ01001070.1.p4  ORF type:complete len:112 (-),score=15.74 GFKZ01001070.1:48-383(-)
MYVDLDDILIDIELSFISHDWIAYKHEIFGMARVLLEELECISDCGKGTRGTYVTGEKVGDGAQKGVLREAVEPEGDFVRGMADAGSTVPVGGVVGEGDRRERIDVKGKEL